MQMGILFDSIDLLSLVKTETSQWLFLNGSVQEDEDWFVREIILPPLMWVGKLEVYYTVSTPGI